LLFSPDKGDPHEYVQILAQQRGENQKSYLNRLQPTHADVQPYSMENLRQGSQVLINARLQVDGLAADCDVLTRVEGTSTFGKHSYEPTIFAGTHSISKEQQLELSFVGYVLERLQHTSPAAGRIIGIDEKSHTVKLGGSAKALRPLLEPLHEWITADSLKPPPIVLNKHCPLCPFQRRCQTQAEQEDNLSLLDGVTARVMRQYERKGIFTVKQLSYLFKPRKRKRGSRKPPPVTHKVELQALAIREQKIYLQELPTLSRQPVELFVDMEGVPDRGLYYLIGMFVCQGDITEHYAFWADTDQDERHIWQQFMEKVAQYPEAPIYHYGSYEPRAIATLAKRYETDAESVTKRLVNMNKHIYGKVYFPVCSNRLKDLGNFLVVQWTSPHASGLQSLVWRHHWEHTQEGTYRAILVTYNKEDCHALKLLTDAVSQIQQSADTLTAVEFADQRKRQTTETSTQIQHQFRTILQFAHFDYDKKKISFRQEAEKETKAQRIERNRTNAYKLQNRLRDIKHKATKVIHLSQSHGCPVCGKRSLEPSTDVSQRTIIDIIPTKNGIKKSIVKYVGEHASCQECKNLHIPGTQEIWKGNQLYGHGFKAWVIYQRVALRLPYNSIVESLQAQFQEKINLSSIPNFMKSMAGYYAETAQGMMAHLLQRPCIHADETKIRIKGADWYIWVITDGSYVIFKLTETRESTWIDTLLAKYPGVLVSDFYAGYDSVPCLQQKCWVHLIRDMNDDMREAPFDAELAWIFHKKAQTSCKYLIEWKV
jgi:predicted RecB family nuclease